MATIVNVAPRGKSARMYTGTDFIKLSFDKKKEDIKNKVMTPEEVDAKFSKYLKSGK